MTGPADREEPFEASEVSKRAGRGVIALGLRGIAMRGMGLLGSIVLARLLLPEDFGTLAFGYTVFTVASIVGGGGLAAALVRQREQVTTIDLRHMLGFQLGASLALAVAIAVVGVATGDQAGYVAAVMAAALPVDSFRMPGSVLCERRLEFAPIARSGVIEVAVYNVIAITLVAVGCGVWGVAIAALIRPFIGSGYMVRFGPAGWVTPTYSSAFVRRVAPFGLQFQSVSLVAATRDQGMNVVIGAAGGLTVLGYWTLVWRLLQAVILVFESLVTVAFPALSKLVQSGADARPVMEKGLNLATLTAGAVLVGLAGTAPALVPAVFGPGWGPTQELLVWASAGALIAGPIALCAVSYLSATNRLREALWAIGIEVVVLLIALYLLVAEFGVRGVGPAWVLGCTIEAILLSRSLRSGTGIRVLRSVVGPIAAAAVAGTAAYLVGHAIQESGIGLIASATVAGLVYPGACLLVARSGLVSLVSMTRRALVR